MKNICIFCGSSMGTDRRYRDAAVTLGEVLADRDCVLYYGGGDVGLMKIIADTMIERGKSVIGVMPRLILDMEIGHKGISKMIEVDSMAQRKEILMREADAFIAMPGGFGTLDEFSEVVVQDQLRIMDKPVALYNTLGYYDDLLKFINRGIDEGFIRDDHRKNIIVTDNPVELLDALFQYKPVSINQWIKDIKEEK